MAYISFQPSDYFNTKTWTGTGSTNALTSVGFQPDWCWIKQRGGTTDHHLYDAVRGVTKALASNNTAAETTKATGLTAFGSDGFTLGADGGVNGSSNTYVGWNWKANGSGSANSDGTITTTYTSANTTSGFSIVEFTGTASNNTVGHGLSTAPRLIIAKNLGTTQNWFVYHQDIQSSNADGYINLNTTDAVSDSSTVWQATAPTSSVFSVGAAFSAHDYVAYCFAEKKGFSKFGSYTGNGNADGTFIYTGFKPAWIMQKRTDSANNWNIYDVKRNTFNIVDKYLYADDSTAEITTEALDITSNGFKCRHASTFLNTSGGSYIYMAFAEHPLVSSNDIPSTAR